MKSIILVLTAVLILVSFSFAGNDPATVYDRFVTFSPSVTALAMGKTGVSYTTSDNFYYNPANLGLLAFKNKMNMGGYLKKADLLSTEIYSSHITFPIHLRDNFKIGIGYSYFKIGTEVMETTEEFPDGTGNIFFAGDHIHRLGIGAGLKKKFDLALGAGLTYVKEDLGDLNNNAIAFDLGGRLGYSIIMPAANDKNKFSFFPSLGFSYTNLGGTKDNNTLSIGDRPVRPIRTETELPNILRYGISNKVAYSKITNDFEHEYISLLLSFEIEDSQENSSSYGAMGVELAVLEILKLRAGKSNGNDFIGWNYKSKGYSLSCSGIKKLLAGENYDPQKWYNRTNLIFTFSRQSYNSNMEIFEWEIGEKVNRDYYELIVGVDI